MTDQEVDTRVNGIADLVSGPDEPKTSDKTPPPPPDLSRAARKWWVQVMEGYALEPHHVHLLTLCARALDRAEAARLALRKGGLVYYDKHKVQRPRPEVLIERNAQTTFARLLRELRLDDVEDDDEPRIPKNSLNWKMRNDTWVRDARGK